QTLEHGIEQHLLLGLGINGGLLLAALGGLVICLKFHLLLAKRTPPPQLQDDQRNQSENEEDEPHDIHLATDGAGKKYRFLFSNGGRLIPRTGSPRRGRYPDAWRLRQSFHATGACECPRCAG